MWLYRIFAQRKKRKKNYKAGPTSLSILPDNLQEEFMKSKKDRDMQVLIEVYKPSERGGIQTAFKAGWRGLERVDQIETLISFERELAAQRKEISSELYQHSKGKW